MALNSYTQENKPKRGTPKKIWDALEKAGAGMIELHYNANCWGAKDSGNGWGTWACTFGNSFKSISGVYVPHEDYGYFCGIYDDKVYVQSMMGAFSATVVGIIPSRKKKASI